MTNFHYSKLVNSTHNRWGQIFGSPDYLGAHIKGSVKWKDRCLREKAAVLTNSQCPVLCLGTNDI
jgi:hypothetical protein